MRVGPVPPVAKAGWGTAERIETDNAGDASSPQIAIDANGNAMAVWYQDDGTRYNVWSNRYNGTNWGTAVRIGDNAGDAYSPQIAIDASGNAIAVWSQRDGADENIWSNRYDGTNWGTAERIGDNAEDAYNSQIAIDAEGNAIAVWQQYDGTQWSIWSNRYDGTNWGAAELIETDNAGDAYSPQIAIDAEGNAMAVWYQWDGTRYSIWSNRYQAL